MFRLPRSSLLASIFCIISPILFVQAVVPSPKATTDLICHTNHASECYPRTFQPTTRFQTVHDDQNLPPGLHIRMNLATGVKEAKLNEPDREEGRDAAGLVVVDDVPYRSPGLRDQSNPQQYTPPARPAPIDLSESGVFASSIDALKASSSSDSNDVIPALSTLEDLSHSHHWGLALARDASLSQILFGFLSPSTSQFQSSPEVRSATALLLATAIHNNPDALIAAVSHFYNDKWPTGPLEAVILALAHEQLPSLLTRMVFLLSALCQDEKQLWKFVQAGGLDLLAEVFDAENAGSDERDRLRGKIANLMFDRFLQLETSIDGPSLVDEKRQGDQGGQGETHGDSPLEGEDAWVMINEKKLSSMQATVHNRQTPTHDGSFRFTSLFKPWCALFKKSLFRLRNHSTSDPEAAKAHENIRNAQLALKTKLDHYGGGCQQD